MTAAISPRLYSISCPHLHGTVKARCASRGRGVTPGRLGGFRSRSDSGVCPSLVPTSASHLAPSTRPGVSPRHMASRVSARGTRNPRAPAAAKALLLPIIRESQAIPSGKGVPYKRVFWACRTPDAPRPLVFVHHATTRRLLRIAHKPGERAGMHFPLRLNA